MADKKAPRIIRVPSSLDRKVSKGGPGAVNKQSLAQAEQVIEDLADDYVDWAKEDLAKLEHAFNGLKDGSLSTEDGLKEVFEVAHDMKGQGGSFDFPLMTAVGDSLCRLTDTLEKVGSRELEGIQLHITTMKLIIASNMKGDGGREGNMLLNGLDLMVEKLS